MLLQAADFLHLYRTLGVELQTGGADQWGNITAGLELIRRVEGGRGGRGARPTACRTRCSWRRTASRSARPPRGRRSGSIPERTSPYAFYQFWLDAEDAAAGRLIRLFTLLDRPTIEALEAEAAGRAGAAARPACARARPDRPGPRRRRRGPGRVEVSEAVFSRRLPELGEAALAFAFEQLPNAIVGPTTSRRGRSGLTVAAGPVRLERRGAPGDRPGRPVDQRAAGRRRRRRAPGADRRALPRPAQREEDVPDRPRRAGLSAPAPGASSRRAAAA